MTNSPRPAKPLVYTSQEDTPKTCIELLKGSVHYKFLCRCGCGATFAGYGRDIKAADIVGRDSHAVRSFKPVPQPKPETPKVAAPPEPSPVPAPIFAVTGQSGSDVTITASGLTDTLSSNLVFHQPSQPTPVTLDSAWANQPAAPKIIIDSSDLVMSTSQETTEAQPAQKEETPPRPLVPDRLIKKAVWKLTEDEVNETAEETDLTIALTKLSDRDPACVGDRVYSLATGRGPFTLVEYSQKNIKSEDGESYRVFVGVLLDADGKCVSLPAADLTTTCPKELPGRERTPFWLLPAILLTMFSVIACVMAALCAAH